MVREWRLQDGSLQGLANHGVELTSNGARFDGRGGYLELADGIALGRAPFRLSLDLFTEADLPETGGDLISQFVPDSRTGFHLSLADHAGVTGSQGNYRNLQFALDAGTEPTWTDCGRPGEAVSAYAMAVCGGELYVGTFEHGEGQVGGVFRQNGEGWDDCGIPNEANCVGSLLAHEDRLYAVTGRYESGGSALGNPGNLVSTSRMRCLSPDGGWTDCGSPGPEDLYILGLYRGKIYAVPNYHVGLYRYDGGTTWVTCAEPYPRYFALAQWRGHLYAAANRGLIQIGPPPERERTFTMLPDADGVYRYDDQTDTWTGCGRVGEETQMYGFAVHQGQLHVSTWPNGLVCRSATGLGWESCGRVAADEKETMAMAVYNGKLYVGTLPEADIYRFDGDQRWTRVGRTDRTPNVTYRRAWSMAVHDGKLFVGTLPSGHVHAMEVGQAVSHSHQFPAGWHRIEAVREAEALRLSVDGSVVASRAIASALDLGEGAPLRIGTGAYDTLTGRIREVRIEVG